MALALFDLDHTLLPVDSNNLWWQYLYNRGVIEASTYESRLEEFNQQYNQGHLDLAGYFQMTADCLNSIPADLLQSIRDDFLSFELKPLITQKARKVLDKHRAAGDTLVLITATHQFLAKPIAELFEISDVICSQLVTEDDRFTGEYVAPGCYKSGKIHHLLEWLNHDEASLKSACFYSDSHNDLPLLERVGIAIAVDPDDTLHTTAKQRNWPVISLRD